MYAFSPKYGRRVVWSLILSEWLNQVLKLLLFGHRPYWWVKIASENTIDNSSSLPEIKQFPLTCETGPGSPSGHAMITAAVWFVIYDSFMDIYTKRRLPFSSLVKVLCFTAYILSIVGVSVSRLYISAHFPHQCVLGGFLGFVIGKVITTKVNLDKFKVYSYIIITIGMIISVLACFSTMTLLGIDPSWSVALAKEHCIRSEYVHLDTTPFFSFMRYTAYFLGFGLAFYSPLVKASNLKNFSLPAKIQTAILSLLISLSLVQIQLPLDNMNIFYLLTFALFTAQSFIFTAVIPYVVYLIWPQSFSTINLRSSSLKSE